jgi:ubiquinone/menaquinone biosynthesis C-methylase UbiE
MDSPKSVLEYWNERAQLKHRAGSDDLLAKRLEIEAIAKHVRDGLRILEVGCGNGITTMALAERYNVDITALDFAAAMVAEATAAAQAQTLKGTVRFQVGDVTKLDDLTDTFDLIFTERVLINLPDWPAQKQAIMNIGQRLREGGVYVMCENSQDGLDKINDFRARVGLYKITPPWHNRYVRDSEIAESKFDNLTLEQVEDYSSTYYFLSRVVNAWLAAQEGKEPAYDALINQMALLLPPIGDLGQGKIWLWRKIAQGSN